MTSSHSSKCQSDDCGFPKFKTSLSKLTGVPVVHHGTRLTGMGHTHSATPKEDFSPRKISLHKLQESLSAKLFKAGWEACLENKELFNWSDKYTHNPLVLYDKSSSFSKDKTNREVFNIGKFLLDLLTDYQTLQKCDFIKIKTQFAVDADLSEHTYNSVYVDGVNMTQLFNDLQNIELFIYSSTNNIDELVTNFSVEELTSKFYQNLSFKIDNESHTIDITLGNFIIDVLFALDCVINL